MSYIVLKKNGFHVKEYDEKSNISSYSKVKGHIGHHLQSVLEVDEGVTVEDLMKELIRHESDIDVIFFGFSKGFLLRPFYQEMLSKPDHKRKDLSYIELSWMSDYYPSDRKGKKNEVMIFMQMNGMAANKRENEAISYNLSQIPLNDWKHLEVRISDLLLVYDFQVNKKDDNGTMGTRVVTLLEAKKEVTLYDFIGGFIDCITWHGYPEHRKEHIDDINAIIHQGEDVDEADLEDKQYELEKAIAREDYEAAAALKKQIDRITKKK
jgi:hypothetical protein